jgi:hypothetical protein
MGMVILRERRWLAALQARQAGFDELRPIAHADGKNLVVEVVGGVVEAECAALADADHAARPLLQHEGEVLAAHGRLDVAPDAGLAENGGGGARGMVAFRSRVQHARAGAVVVERRGGPEGRGDAGDDPVQPRLDQVLDRLRQRPNRAPQLRRLRDDVVGRAGIHMAERDDGTGERVDVARRRPTGPRR